jgi:hypothetical protein
MESAAKVDKTTVWLSQKRKVFESLYQRPQTRLEVSVNNGVPIQNTCRLVGDFRKSGTVYIVGRDICPISGMRAEILSTNPEFKAGVQLQMFE